MPETEYSLGIPKDESARMTYEGTKFSVFMGEFKTIIFLVLEPSTPENKDKLLDPIRSFRTKVEKSLLELDIFASELEVKSSPIQDQVIQLKSSYNGMLTLLNVLELYILFKGDMNLTAV